MRKYLFHEYFCMKEIYKIPKIMVEERKKTEQELGKNEIVPLAV